MNSLGQALKKLLNDLGIEDNVTNYQVINLWTEVVGKKIATVSTAEKIENKILFVKVTNDSWRNELTFHKKEIVEKLNNKIGKRVIEDIRLF
jgi:predicted nucleic acid-binding Zn ribbon protein